MIRMEGLLRTLLLLFSGVMVGALMVLTSVSFAPFSPVPVSMSVLYLVMFLVGALLPTLYHDLTAIAMACLLIWLVAITMLGVALSAGLVAVGWELTFDTVLSLIGMHLLTYTVTLLVVQSAGCALALLLRRN